MVEMIEVNQMEGQAPNAPLIPQRPRSEAPRLGEYCCWASIGMLAMALPSSVAAQLLNHSVHSAVLSAVFGGGSAGAASLHTWESGISDDTRAVGTATATAAAHVIGTTTASAVGACLTSHNVAHAAAAGATASSMAVGLSTAATGAACLILWGINMAVNDEEDFEPTASTPIQGPVAQPTNLNSGEAVNEEEDLTPTTALAQGPAAQPANPNPADAGPPPYVHPAIGGMI